MSNLDLTSDLLLKVAALPKKQRSAVMKLIGDSEFKRCSADPLYWLDASQHVKTAQWPNGLPYVFTKDPHKIYLCKTCGGEVVENNRVVHLEISHGQTVSTSVSLAKFYDILPAVRPFTVMDYMPPIIHTWMNHQYFALEKSRDMMATWLMIALSTWDCMFNDGRQHIFQSQDAGKTFELVSRSNIIYQNMPSWLRQAVGPIKFSKGDSKSGELFFIGRDSEVLGFPQGADQIRQYHPSLIFLDEAAFQNQAGEAFAAIKPAILMGGKAVLISSANRSFFELVCRDKTDG